ncbi:hypothetical protein VTN96DRAFT_494 [Rasamsonia emersonii]|uniref:U3 small nucleolar RNA-associated protein 22 n=1 Tax=Rasamsonia emersonii (strain ATCC 16479 / CBS 393.64 / IMI 116815) TaxID=1408163 RepID=A0A0F4Z5D0_RASE3|nr:hypothetical protein T310_0212 [Rasamsonia emersonii CBS 393.64]KKA25734.1 hypothetical protein T310_0212 [Rasamsonia emersonii CBS 393.64]
MISHTAKRRKLNPTETNNAAQVEDSLLDSRLRTSSNNSAEFTDEAETVRDAQMKGSDKASPRNGESKRVNIDRSAELARANGLSKSGLFKLQTDELLTELRPDYDKLVSQVHDVLSKVKDTICRVPDRPSKPPLEAEREMRKMHGITIPFPSPPPDGDAKYPMAFRPPANVNVVGSVALRTGMRMADPFNIDLAVTMPGTLFQEKDYLNYRFFHKRAYYIACIAAGIQEEKSLPLTLSFGLQDGDSLRPIIILEPSDDAPHDLIRLRLRIRIITAIEDDVFPISKTLPTKNNIRSTALVNKEGSNCEESTPFYNSSLRSEATVAPYHRYLHSATQKHESMRDACILGRAWLRQRGFGTAVHDGGFGGFEWTALLALLFEGGGPNGKPVLLPSYSSYQIFKATMQFLSGRDLMQPLAWSARDVAFPPGGPVLYDGKRGLNLLYKMTPWSYALLRHESKLTLAMLNESRFDHFDKIFILQTSQPVLRFDRLFFVTSPQQMDGTLQLLQYQHTMYQILTRALGDRVRLIHLSSQDVPSWSPATHPASQKSHRTIMVGLLLDAENANRLVDHGPPAEQKDEAASFRAFWGEKAELRRFRDGRILESLVWSEQESANSVVYQVLTYALRRHLNIFEEYIRCTGEEYDKRVRDFCGPVSSSSGPFQLVYDAFQALQQSLQNMEDIPLSVRQLQPASPHLRFTALSAMSEGSIVSEPVEVILQLESSTKWPDDLVAIQLTKVAFLTKIGDLLKSDGSIRSFRVGLENDSSKILNRAFLDVIHTSQVVFRLRIHHDREQTLLERKLKEKGLSASAKEEFAAALSEYKQLFIQGPRLTQAIRTLCTRFSLLSPTIRLMKHWFHSHLLLSNVKEEFVELLTTHTFVQCYPWEAPSSVMSGFFRTLLFISRWNWQREPFIVDLGGLTTQELSVIETRFLAWRSVDPAMKKVALVVASEIDQDGVTWTLNGMPPKVVAARISSLAKAAVNLLKQKGTDINIESFFKSSLAPYDFVIHLNPKQTGHDRRHDSLKFKNIGNAVSDKFEPSNTVTSFLQELQAAFSHCILFFYGDKQCNVIGGLWKPELTTPKPWGLKMAYSTCPAAADSSRETNDVTLNRSSILNEIARLGGAMIESIEIHCD